MLFADVMALDAPRRSSEGYMGVHAKGARSGTYQYLGREIDPDGQHFQADQVVNVYRDPAEVFNVRALGSFVAKPITDDHPTKPVTAKNWRDLARGTVMGALQEGDYVGFDLAFLDEGVVEAIDTGKRELSCGYSSEIVVGDGQAPDGTNYQARQVNIRGNHVALVDKGRAGSTCRVGDAALCETMPSDEVRKILTDERTYNADENANKNEPARRETSISGGSPVATKTITFDGLPLEVTDAAEAAITKLQGHITALTADKTALDTKVGELTAAVSTKDGEIVALNQKVKDAEIGPDKLQQLVADRATLVAQAKAIDPNVVTDGKTEVEIRKAVVDAKLGDAAKDLDDGAISGAFKAFAKDVKPADPVRDALSTGVRTNTNDSGASVRDLARAAQY